MNHYRHRIIVTGFSTLYPQGGRADYVREELDLPDGFGLTFQRSVQELNNVNQIKRLGAMEFTLPMTPRNDRLLRRFKDLGIIDNGYLPLVVECWIGSYLSPLDRMAVKVTNIRGGGYDCEISTSQELWIEAAENLKIRDIELGSFTFSAANCLDIMQNGGTYSSSPDLVLFLPPVEYGSKVLEFLPSDIDLDSSQFNIPNHGVRISTAPPFTRFYAVIRSSGNVPSPLTKNAVIQMVRVDENKVAPEAIALEDVGDGKHELHLFEWYVEDLRPLFNVPALLKIGFQKIGYRLEGSILVHPKVKKWWQYLLAENYYDTGGNEAYWYFRASRAAPLAVDENTTDIKWDNVIENAPALATSPIGFQEAYRNETGYVFEADATLFMSVSNPEPTTRTYIFQLIVRDVDLNTISMIEDTVTVQPFQSGAITLQAKAELKPFWWVDFLVSSTSAPFQMTLETGSYLNVQPSTYPKHIIKGSTHELAKMIHGDITLLDLFKGFVHLPDLKLESNDAEKIITLHPTEKTEYFGEAMEGFYRPAHLAKDLTKHIEERSQIVTFPDELAPRKIRLKFKDSTDPYIEEVHMPTEENPYHGRTVDLGEPFRGEALTVENPLYEPTAERPVSGMVIPTMTDNDEGDLSHRIAPRIVEFVGNVRQAVSEAFTSTFDDDFNPVAEYDVEEAFWIFEGQRLSEVPYVSQLPRATLIGSPPPDGNIVYGTEAGDLYSVFWQKARFQRAILPEVAFLVRLNTVLFFQEDFRQRWFVTHEGKSYVYQLIQLLEHFTGDDSSTDAVLIPEPNFTN